MNGETNYSKQKIQSEARINYEYPPSFDYCPQSEHRVVRQLILSRSKQDKAHEMLLYDGDESIVRTSGAPVLSEDIACTYIDLDTLIETCGLSKLQRFVVDEAMKGYSVSDISSHHDMARQTADGALRAAIDKIVSKNNELWAKCHCG